MNRLVSEDTFEEVLNIALERFNNIEFLSEEQKSSIAALLNRRDVFSILPTGHGKSLIFQLLPDLCRQLHLRGYDFPKNAIIIVICPLKSLIESHIREIERYGLRASSVCEEGDEAAILRGDFSFVFGSPESFLENEKWRNMVQSKEYQSRLFSFVADEAHVVPKWGFDKDEKSAFRKAFSRIGELRSLGRQGTPMLALTATAKLSTQEEVIKSLAMKKDHLLVYVSPYRKNIYLTTKEVSTNRLETFSWLIDKLKAEKNNLERTIVYCKSIKDCGRLFKMFKHELGSDAYYPQGIQQESQNLLFGMFHHNTLDKHKERILNSFHDECGTCRVVFATNALGMGVNFPDVRTVINYGPPRDIEELVQEIGRAGRDGKPALSVLLFNGRQMKKCEEAVIDYCQNTVGCLRKLLAANFQQINELTFECGTHNCCKHCHMRCDCNDTCSVQLPLFDPPNTQQKHAKIRKVSREDKQLLEELLLDSTESKQMGLMTYLHPECTAGFSKSLVKATLRHCKYIFTIKDVFSYLPILKSSHAVDILLMFNDIFQDIDPLELVQHDSTVDDEQVYDLTYGQSFELSESSSDEEQ